MRLSTFILQNIEAILTEWEAFARTLLPVTHGMTPDLLRDHAQQMLETIAADIATEQSATEQQVKSRGGRERDSSLEDSASEVHASGRHESGFSLEEVVAEYRALRASVIRLWNREIGEANRQHLDELTRFNEALDEALTEAVKRFTGAAARDRDLLLGALGHDLRNPLSAVVHSAHFLMRSELATDSQRKAVARIVNSGGRMQEMIADLLDLAVTRLGDLLPVARERMNMAEACQSTIDEIRTIHPQRTIHFEATGDLRGHWDHARIGQLLSNLVANAIDHGSPEGPISVNAFASEDVVTVTVHNEGAPIPLHLRHRIFEPLARGIKAPPAITNSGRSLGLGLYIACQITRAHGGALKLTSTDASGTTFSATLPRDATIS